MAKRKKARKSHKKSPLKRDLQNLSDDWKSLQSKKTLARNKKFLKKLANDLKKLNNDSLRSEENAPTAKLVHHIIATPLGAPFVSDTTLLDAALEFDYQDPINSDLSHLVSNFTRYNTYFDNEIIKIFDSFMHTLEAEED